DEQAAHVGLNGVVHIRQIHALLQHLVSVHIDELLWHVREKCCRNHPDFRTLASGCYELVQVIGKKLDIFAGAVLKYKGDATSGAYARYGRRRETEHRSIRQAPEFQIQARLDRLVLFGLTLAVLPGL